MPTVNNILQLALTEHQQGRLTEAENLYRKILNQDSNQPDALHYLGVIYHQRGDNSTAIELIRKAMQIHSIPEMAQNLAATLVSMGKQQDAICVLQEASKKFNNDKKLLFNLAGLFRSVNDWKSSRDCLALLVAESPDWADALLNLANAESKLGNKEAALQRYLEALKINPLFAAAHSNLGAYYSDTDNLKEGIEHNRRAVEIEPNFAPYHYNFGNALLTAGRAGEALEHFENAVKIDCQYVNAWINLAAARHIAGDLEGAIESNKRAVALNPNSAKAFINQGNIALQLRRYKEAEQLLRRGLELEESNYTAWATLGEVFRQLGHLEQAKVALKKSIDLAPGNGRTWVLLATVEEQMNQNLEAEYALRQAFTNSKGLGINSFSADRRYEARLNLANLMSLSGRKEEADKLFEDALETIKILRPGLVPKKIEKNIIERPIVLFQPVGRAGSLFLHSLFDGHPEISTTPAALLKGFFGNGVWEGLCPSFNSEDWRERLTDRFCKVYEPLFDSTSHLPVPGNPLGEPMNVARGFGLCEMGHTKDKALVVDVHKFKKLMIDSLKIYSEISAPAFFRLVHDSYANAIGRVNGNMLFYHIHNPDVSELAGCLVGYSNIRFLNIVREPIQSVESWMQTCLNGKNDPETLLCGYQDAVERLQGTLRQSSNLVFDKYPTATIRLEDIKRKKDSAINALTNWLDISYDDSLNESTFGGIIYEAPANSPVKGFETTNLDRKPGALFSEHDQRVMNLLLYPIAIQYGYRECNPIHLKREIEWYKSRTAEPLDFEKKIISKLAQLGRQKDVYGPRRRLQSIAERCVNLLERFGNYPAMAPWLRVD